MRLPPDPHVPRDDFTGCRGIAFAGLLILAVVAIVPHIGAAIAWIGGLLR